MGKIGGCRIMPPSKNYDKLFTKEQLENEYQDKSVCSIAKKYNIANTCLYRLFDKFGIKRRHKDVIYKSKHGKSSRVNKKCCIDCGKELSTNPNAIRCNACNNIRYIVDKDINNKRIKGIINKYNTDPNYKLDRSGKNSVLFGKISHGKGSYYKSIWMRSSYEVAYAKWLDRQGIKWLYEPKTFDLGNTTYTPDFYLPEFDLYIEIKGWWRDDAKKKFEEFKKRYNEIKIKILEKRELKIEGVL